MRAPEVVLRVKKKEPAIDIAGLCLPLKPQKERCRIFFHCRLFLAVITIPTVPDVLRADYINYENCK